MRGLLDRLTGKRKRIEEQNRQEMAQAQKRDRGERVAIRKEESRTLARSAKRAAFKQARANANIEELNLDRKALSQAFENQADANQGQSREAFKAQRRSRERDRPKRRQGRSRDGRDDQGPSP